MIIQCNKYYWANKSITSQWLKSYPGKYLISTKQPIWIQSKSRTQSTLYCNEINTLTWKPKKNKIHGRKVYPQFIATRCHCPLYHPSISFFFLTRTVVYALLTQRTNQLVLLYKYLNKQHGTNSVIVICFNILTYYLRFCITHIYSDI